MPIAAYSQVLWELLAGYPIPGPQLSSPVPPSTVWVVREVTAYRSPAPKPGIGVRRIVLEAGVMPIWATPLNGSVAGEVYPATDVRFVLEEGTQLQINTDDPNWVLRVSGYQLSTAPGSFVRGAQSA